MRRIKLAIIDLYGGIPNQGMRCIREIVEGFSDRIDYEVFDLRRTNKAPGLDFDIYISSGGPGDPRLSGDAWEKVWGSWLDSVWLHNQTVREPSKRKNVFFICHSFQMAVRHFDLAEVEERQSMAFGIFPFDPNEDGDKEPLFAELDRPFWVTDFREYQILQPNEEALNAFGATVLGLEKERPNVPLERAIMAIRWTDEIFGTQFHPEADADGMMEHFRRPDIKEKIFEEHSEEKWDNMMRHLRDPDKIARTHDAIIPEFIRRALQRLDATA
ncbi:MAG: GMP synthase [Saprospiraceae bacterium]